jgi:hypothetical protein
LAKVQKKLGCPRAALGSLSEAANVFDAQRLRENIAELGEELQPLGRDERAVLERIVQPDHLYVMDRGHAKFALFNKIVTAHSSYVCRLRDNSTYTVVQTRELTEADRVANVLSDQIVQFSNGKADARPDHPLRLVCIQGSPHTSRGKYRGGSTGPDSDGILRIATNLLDVLAEIIALIYRFRWAIELDLRNIKVALHLDDLRGRSPEMVRREILVSWLAYNLIRQVMAQAALAHSTVPRKLSFAGAVDAVVGAWDHATVADEACLRTLAQVQHRFIASFRVGDRPNRVEPRAVKRRPKPHKLLRCPRNEAREELLGKHAT